MDNETGYWKENDGLVTETTGITCGNFTVDGEIVYLSDLFVYEQPTVFETDTVKSGDFIPTLEDQALASDDLPEAVVSEIPVRNRRQPVRYIHYPLFANRFVTAACHHKNEGTVSKCPSQWQIHSYRGWNPKQKVAVQSRPHF